MLTRMRNPLPLSGQANSFRLLLTLIDTSEQFPFRPFANAHGHFPRLRGQLLGGVCTMPKGSPAGELSAKPTEGLKQTKSCKLVFTPSGFC